MTRLSFVTVTISLFCGATLYEVRADVPPDLAEAATYQMKNKAAIVATLQQRAAALRKSGDVEGSKRAKKTADDVRSNKVLVLPPLGIGDLEVGTLQVERVIENTEEGVRIKTSIPRFENTGVNVTTGGRGSSPWAMGFVFYPAEIDVATATPPKAGDTINVRRGAGRTVSEVPATEMEAAAALLRK